MRPTARIRAFFLSPTNSVSLFFFIKSYPGPNQRPNFTADMASDDEDERLAHFLEYDLLSEDSDLEELETVEREHKMKGTQDGKRHRVQVDVFSEDEEKERQEAKKIRVEAGEISDEGLSRAIGSCSPQSLLPSELESEVEDAASHPKESDIAETSKNSGKRSAENKQEESDIAETSKKNNGKRRTENKQVPRRIQTGIFSQIPPELLYNILKFLSSEDLVSCSLVCRFMNFIAADETLWRRLYCMRWGLLPPKKVRECAWKKLYIQRDEEDMAYFVRHCPSEFKEYYIQMQVAKRSQAPHPSQVKDDRIVLDKTVADQVSMWKSSKGLNETVVENHACSGNTCTYYQIGNAFVCEKTGNVHVCDDACKEIVMDRTDELLVCTISGRCFENIDNRPLSATEVQLEAEQAGSGDEAEPFMGSGLFGRAYILGYNCEDERELDDALRFC